MSLHVGTSGWAYKEWKPDFYPADLPQKRFLEHYGTRLSALEINATFYRKQSPTTFEKWFAATPDGFRFTTKAHRGLTYGKNISVDGDRALFLRDVLADAQQLGPKLGALLFLFPKHKDKDPEGFRSLLNGLKGGPPFAFEFRHPAWGEDPEVAAAVAEGGGTMCFSETEGAVPESLPDGPIAYVRMRSATYSPEAREGWAELLQREAATRPVYVFSKHEGIATDDPFGGIGLASWLAERVAEAS
jgi:uncharacterized protein YecE (DUF72 family)